MDDALAPDGAIEAIALLDDPRRRQLYELVVASHAPVGRDDAAASLGMSRELAAFHLDRLVAGGLLDTEFRRRSGRTGPGAGRPAKLYRRARHEVAVSLPRRAYPALAEVFASALDRLDGPEASGAVRDVAHHRGVTVGTEARREAGSRPSHRRLKEALLRRLRGAGFEPSVDPTSGDVNLRNCPYAALSASHRELTCGMNLAWADGVVEGLIDPRLGAGLAPEPGRCCVVFRESSGRAHVADRAEGQPG